MSEVTPRLGLPLLAAGQAQKEIAHNEALVLIDQLAQPAAEGVSETPPAVPLPGQSWIGGASPVGAWSGHAGALACWTDGGWRFVAPRSGMAVWIGPDGLLARYRDGAWRTGAASPAVSGGSVIDAQARAAIGALQVVLRRHGLIAE
jgi:hypothetical protein